MSGRYRFGSCELDAAEHRLSCRGRPVTLTRRAFDTLLFLVRNPGRLVTRDELIDGVWGETIVEEGNLHWTISAVRRALAEESAEAPIETVRGLGYRFVLAVEEIAEGDGAEAVGGAAETAPPRTAGSRWWAAAGVAVLLLAGLAVTVAGRRQAATPPAADGVAVVGFRNLSPEGDGAWVGTALAEMLTADLGRPGRLRVVPGDEVAGMRLDLGLRPDAPLASDRLAAVGRRLGSAWVVSGSYLLIAGREPPLRVEALLHHTGSGETRSRVGRSGRPEELPALADALAEDLRRALGEPPAGAAGAETARGTMPAPGPAQELYAEGLERLRRREAVAAVERLEAAVAADPGFAPAWLALAQALDRLGSARRAEDAALAAVERSSGLAEPQRLAIEATYLRLTRRRPEAADRLLRVYELSRHGFEEGLALAEAQGRAGRTAEALATLDELRREHPAACDDARLDLLATETYQLMDDSPNELASAGRAVAGARRQGMVEVEVQALKRLALSRMRTGSVGECGAARGDLAEARRKAEAAGDRLLLAGTLLTLGSVLADCEGPAAAEPMLREAGELYREVGALGRLPPVLYNLGDLRLAEGDLLGADRSMREALETCQAHAALCRERFLHPLGVNRLHRGDLAEARRMIEEGIDLNRRIGNRFRVAEAEGFLPDLATWSGDLALAVELQRRTLAAREEIGTPDGIAWARIDLAAGLALAGRGTEALAEARGAAELADEDGESSLVACSRAALGTALLAAGDLAGADRESARAIALLRPPRLPFASFWIWRVRAEVLLARGQLAAAEALVDEGLELTRRSGMVTYELEGRLLQTRLAQARGRTAEARRLAGDLAAEARAKGFGLIAERSEAVLAAAGPAGPAG